MRCAVQGPTITSTMGPWFATRAEYFSGGPSSVISLETSDIVMAGVVRAQTLID